MSIIGQACDRLREFFSDDRASIDTALNEAALRDWRQERDRPVEPLYDPLTSTCAVSACYYNSASVSPCMVGYFRVTAASRDFYMPTYTIRSEPERAARGFCPYCGVLRPEPNNGICQQCGGGLYDDERTGGVW